MGEGSLVLCLLALAPTNKCINALLVSASTPGVQHILKTSGDIHPHGPNNDWILGPSTHEQQLLD